MEKMKIKNKQVMKMKMKMQMIMKIIIIIIIIKIKIKMKIKNKKYERFEVAQEIMMCVLIGQLGGICSCYVISFYFLTIVQKKSQRILQQ